MLRSLYETFVDVHYLNKAKCQKIEHVSGTHENQVSFFRMM